MSPALIADRDVVLVVTVTGPTIDAADVAVLQTAVNTRASAIAAAHARQWMAGMIGRGGRI